MFVPGPCFECQGLFRVFIFSANVCSSPPFGCQGLFRVPSFGCLDLFRVTSFGCQLLQEMKRKMNFLGEKKIDFKAKVRGKLI